MPGSNVAYLPKQQIIPKTFAANIHELLSDSFFMKEGFVGEFAKQKVLEVVDHFRSNGKEYDFSQNYVYSIIDMIGEPTIRGKLFEEYLKFYNVRGNDRITALQKEIDNIRSEEND